MWLSLNPAATRLHKNLHRLDIVFNMLLYSKTHRINTDNLSHEIDTYLSYN